MAGMVMVVVTDCYQDIFNPVADRAWQIITKMRVSTHGSVSDIGTFLIASQSIFVGQCSVKVLLYDKVFKETTQDTMWVAMGFALLQIGRVRAMECDRDLVSFTYIVK